MPHPERACEWPLGSADGLIIFESVVEALSKREVRPLLQGAGSVR
jgi:hypothetical protein